MKPTEIIAKLQIIKELTAESSVKQLCEVLIDYISNTNKGQLGFRDEELKK